MLSVTVWYISEYYISKNLGLLIAGAKRLEYLNNSEVSNTAHAALTLALISDIGSSLFPKYFIFSPIPSSVLLIVFLVLLPKH